MTIKKIDLSSFFAGGVIYKIACPFGVHTIFLPDCFCSSKKSKCPNGKNSN
jgi:hypothetical protein